MISSLKDGGFVFQIDMIEPHDNPTGWFYPMELIRLWEKGTINDSEFLLLGKILILQDEQRGGCWASNAWLGKWWGGRHEKHVSRILAKFERLKLIQIKNRRGKDRLVVTRFVDTNRNKNVTLNRNKNVTQLKRVEFTRARGGAHARVKIKEEEIDWDKIPRMTFEEWKNLSPAQHRARNARRGIIAIEDK